MCMNMLALGGTATTGGGTFWRGTTKKEMQNGYYSSHCNQVLLKI